MNVQILGCILIAIILAATIMFAEFYTQYLIKKKRNSIPNTTTIARGGNPVNATTNVTATSDMNITNPCHDLNPVCNIKRIIGRLK